MYSKGAVKTGCWNYRNMVCVILTKSWLSYNTNAREAVWMRRYLIILPCPQTSLESRLVRCCPWSEAFSLKMNVLNSYH